MRRSKRYSNMKVIYLKNVKGEAKKDDIREVSDGFALNKLIPQGLAVRATDAAIAQIQAGKQLSAESEAKKDAEMAALLSKLKSTKSITISDHQHAKGRLYNAVTAQEISHAIKNQHNIFIPRELLLDYESKREVGEFEVTIGDKKQSISYTLKIT